MKRDELHVASLFEFEKVLKGKSNKLFYAKADVDVIIANLKSENESLNAALNKCQDITQQCFKREIGFRRRIDELDAKNQNSKQELRATKRALWLARTKNARFNVQNRQRVINTEFDQNHPDIEFIHHHEKVKQKWMNVELLCKKKAKEYK